MKRFGILIVGAALAVCVSGCATDQKVEKPAPPSPAKLEFHIAQVERRRDWLEYTDPSGRLLYVGPAAELTQDDVLRADAMVGDRGSIIRVTLTPIGAQRLGDLTRLHLGKRLAIFIDDRLACAPVIMTESDGNEVFITGDFTRAEAQRLAASLTRVP